MNWEPFLLPALPAPADLADAARRLLDIQRKNWALFRRNEAALDSLRTMVLSLAGDRVVVQLNPGRRRSTLARLDDEAIARRPCFLCPENLPAEERGLAWAEFIVLVNPYPILPRHLTIPAREHIPQRLAGRGLRMLELARALGPDMAVFYNGPRCGATAPDHLHFQACAAEEIPLLRELAGEGRRVVHSFGRRLLVAAGREPEAVADMIERMARRPSPGEPELPLNVLCRFDSAGYFAAVWPRSKLRPARFMASGGSRIAVSPAALEMGGVLVVAVPEHFFRLDAAAARSIYEEVSVPAAEFERLAEEVL